MMVMRIAEPQRQQKLDRLPKHLGRGIAKDLLGALVEEHDLLLIVDRYDRIIGDIKDAGETRLRIEQRLIGTFASGDIAQNDRERYFAIQIELRDRRLSRELGSILAPAV